MKRDGRGDVLGEKNEEKESSERCVVGFDGARRDRRRDKHHAAGVVLTRRGCLVDFGARTAACAAARRATSTRAGEQLT